LTDIPGELWLLFASGAGSFLGSRRRDRKSRRDGGFREIEGNLRLGMPRMGMVFFAGADDILQPVASLFEKCFDHAAPDGEGERR
jgi:hypothetical protein